MCLHNRTPAPSNGIWLCGITCGPTRKKPGQYGVLKQALAEKFPYDIDGYCDGKEAFMKELEGAALDWAKGTQWQGFPAALPKERENR